LDVLSEVLSAVRLTGAFYFKVNAAEPWIATNPSMGEIGSAVMPDAEHVIPFHIMMEGSGWAMSAHNLAPVPLERGSIVMFPRGDSHILSSHQQIDDLPETDAEFYRDSAANKVPFRLVQIGGHGDQAQFVCGYLGCDARPFNPLLEALPDLLVVNNPQDGNDFHRELVLIALKENDHPSAGSETILAKISELMFVQALRTYMDNLAETSDGWLSGLRDPQVGAALKLIHSQPARRWTLAFLAKEIGMSRSMFAERFLQFTGLSPINYLVRWRMQLASKLLARNGASIGQVARAVGYQSDGAFKRAFKKHVGTPPGQWSRTNTQ